MDARDIVSLLGTEVRLIFERWTNCSAFHNKSYCILSIYCNIFLQLAVEYEENALFVKVDTDDEYEFAKDMQVHQSWSTLVFVTFLLGVLLFVSFND